MTISEWLDETADKLEALSVVNDVQANARLVLSAIETGWKVGIVDATQELAFENHAPPAVTVKSADPELLRVQGIAGDRILELLIQSPSQVRYVRTDAGGKSEGQAPAASGDVWPQLFRWLTFGEQFWSNVKPAKA